MIIGMSKKGLTHPVLFFIIAFSVKQKHRTRGGAVW